MTRWELRDGLMVESQKGEWVRYDDVRTSSCAPADPELKELVHYFSEKHKAIRGFTPTIYWPRDMKIFQRIKKGGYSAALIKSLIDMFFGWNGRTCTSMLDFEKKVDMLYGIKLDKAKGRK